MENRSDNLSSSHNEQERLNKLYGYTALNDFVLSGTFQHVASMAAKIFNVPFAFVSFVEEENILVKASVGIEGESSIIAREIGLCSHAVLRDDVTFFENAKLEQKLAQNHLVHGDFGLQFYAGAPVKTQDGYNIGVVAIGDRKPRKFTKEEEQLLVGLAAMVMDELEEKQALFDHQSGASLKGKSK
ncbi:GAF domain-containing protein [Rufibacter hautae]|uniref:GAF domain-containing protein n=1 Tax=Rufibacter hautae TaxID=2595005 RepID=A0A5B6TDY3_9BACT|nr:GAF domain-containing protein [Rufibacter hautae]KAA3438669.1 GAF domain-containing protein [Rufibacter hautae]